MIALVAIFALNGFVAYTLTARQQGSAQQLHYTGRQQLLAQRMVSLALWGPGLNLELAGADSVKRSFSLDSLAREVDVTYATWRDMHDKLQRGDGVLRLRAPTPLVRAQMEALDQLVHDTDTLIHNVSGDVAAGRFSPSYYRRIHALGDVRVAYVEAIDKVVSALAADSNEFQKQLVAWEMCGGALFLMVIVIVSLKVMHPAAKSVEISLHSLRQSNEALAAKSNLLELVRADLEVEHAALLEQQDALEQNTSELARLHEITDASPDAIMAFHPDGTLIYANRAARQMAGPSHATLSARQALNELTPESRQLVLAEGVPSAIRDGVWRAEIALQVADHTRPVRQTLIAHRWPDGSLSFLSSVMQDLSEVREAQDEVLLGAARYRSVVEALAEGVLVQDQSGRIVAWNSSAERILGVATGSLAGRSLNDASWSAQFEDGSVVEDADQPIVRARVHNTPVDGVRMQVTRGDGSRRWLRVNARPVVSATGDAPVAAVATFADVTDQLALAKEHERLSIVVRQSDHAVIMTDETLRIVWVNDAWCRLTGFSVEEAMGRHPAELTHGPHTNAATIATMREEIRAGRAWHGEVLNYRKNGTPYWLELSTNPLRSPEGAITGWVALSHDITDQRTSARERERLSAAVAMTTDGIAILGVGGTLEFVNAAFARMHGLSVTALTGAPWQRVYASEESDRLARAFGPVVLSVGAWRGEATGQRADGSSFPQAVSISQLPNGGQVLVVRDITEAKKAEASLRFQARHDELTGLLNRRGFLEQAAQTITAERRAATPMAMLFGDLDRFKSINDTYGHDVGDDALRAAASTLQSVFRESDLLARLGGDEFTVLASRLTPADVDGLRERLEVQLAFDNAARRARDEPWQLGMSLGVAYFNADSEESLDAIMQRADEALYLEKKSRKAGEPALARPIDAAA